MSAVRVHERRKMSAVTTEMILHKLASSSDNAALLLVLLSC